jgi:hypothetical protein
MRSSLEVADIFRRHGAAYRAAHAGHLSLADLVIAAGLGLAQFQPVQGALAGHRRAVLAPRLQLTGQYGHHRVVAQRVVVVQILIAHSQGEHPLAHQGGDLVLNPLRLAGVPEATRQPVDQTDRPIRRPQQQSPGVRRHHPTVEAGHHLTAFDTCKLELFRVTLCRHRGVPMFCVKMFSQNNFLRIYASMHLIT